MRRRRRRGVMRGDLAFCRRALLLHDLTRRCRAVRRAARVAHAVADSLRRRRFRERRERDCGEDGCGDESDRSAHHRVFLGSPVTIPESRCRSRSFFSLWFPCVVQHKGHKGSAAREDRRAQTRSARRTSFDTCAPTTRGWPRRRDPRGAAASDSRRTRHSTTSRRRESAAARSCR